MRTTHLMFKILFAPLVVGLAVAGLSDPSKASLRAAPTGVTHRVMTAAPASGPGFNGVVRTIGNLGSVVYVGGDFTRVSDATGVYVRRYAAAFDSATGRLLRWNPRPNARVSAIETTRTGVYLGGSFTQVKGKPRRHLALVRPGGDTQLLGFRHRINGDVTALARYRGTLFAGGAFTAVDGRERLELASFKQRGAYRLLGWSPKARKGPVHDLVATGAGVYVAGHFHHINKDLSSRRLALVNRTSGAVVRSFNPATEKPVFSLAVDSARVYAAVGGSGGGYAAGYTRSTGAQTWLRRFDGDVQAVALHGGTLYAGGHFHTVCNVDSANPVNGDCFGGFQIRQRMAALSTNGVLLGWNPGADSLIGVKVIDALGTNGVAFGGDFTTVAGLPRIRAVVFR